MSKLVVQKTAGVVAGGISVLVNRDITYYRVLVARTQAGLHP